MGVVFDANITTVSVYVLLREGFHISCQKKRKKYIWELSGWSHWNIFISFGHIGIVWLIAPSTTGEGGTDPFSITVLIMKTYFLSVTYATHPAQLHGGVQDKVSSHFCNPLELLCMNAVKFNFFHLGSKSWLLFFSISKFNIHRAKMLVTDLSMLSDCLQKYMTCNFFPSLNSIFRELRRLQICPFVFRLPA